MTSLLALTPGDVTGIGPEVACRLLADLPGQGPRPVVYGDPAALARAAAWVGAELRWHPVGHPSDAVPAGHVALMPVPLATLPPPGRQDPAAGAHALACVEAAAAAALAGDVAGLVTGPICKEAILPGRPGFIGHTELLAGLAGVEDFGMLLVVDDFRVLHVTTHASVREAVDLITTPAVLRTIRLAARSLAQFGLPTGPIAVGALNPHAGEGGRFGREEIEVIAPAIAQARAEGLEVEGPLPPDTVFFRARQGHFAAIVAMLHDHGHVPLKMWGMDRGINVTVGLPFVRTSVDHGTAFDLAGTGRADVGSFRSAWDLAARLVAGHKPAPGRQ